MYLTSIHLTHVTNYIAADCATFHLWRVSDLRKNKQKYLFSLSPGFTCNICYLNSGVASSMAFTKLLTRSSFIFWFCTFLPMPGVAHSLFSNFRRFHFWPICYHTAQCLCCLFHSHQKAALLCILQLQKNRQYNGLQVIAEIPAIHEAPKTVHHLSKIVIRFLLFHEVSKFHLNFGKTISIIQYHCHEFQCER